MNQTQKKSHLIRNIAIVAIVIIAIVIILFFIVVNYTYRSSTPTTFALTGVTYILPSKLVELNIFAPYGAKDISLSIDFYVSESTNFVNWQSGPIYCYIMNFTNFVNWEIGHQAYFIYNSGQVSMAKAIISLPGPGKYFIVFDNTFSVFSSKTVYYSITVKTTLL